MKKILLSLFFLFNIIVIAAHAADLNPYAYGVTTEWLSPYLLRLNWSTQAPTTKIRIIAKDSQGEHVIHEEPARERRAYSLDINMIDLLAKGVMPNEEITFRIDVYGKNRDTHDLVEGTKTVFRSPFSIDIDNNENSPYFGILWATQMMWCDTNGDKKNDYPRGIWKFDQWLSSIGAWNGVCNGKVLEDITPTTTWHSETHGVPHMVRVIPDGTGRLLVTSSDRSQNTYLWLIKDPEHMTAWSEVINSDDLREWLQVDGHKHENTVKFANIGLDIRENGDNWELLLFSATVNEETKTHVAGSVYSGIYTVPKSSQDFKGGTYKAYTAPYWGQNSYGNNTFISHTIVSNSYVGGMLSANANFDKNGGVLYNAYTGNSDVTPGPDKSALIHRATNGTFKTDYADGDYLKRKTVITKGLRFNGNRTKVAIAQGEKSSVEEIRIYDVDYKTNSQHLTLKNGVGVDMITGNRTSRAYIHDIVWDHAQNIYVSVRNQTNMHGIYAIATDLGSNPVVSTSVKGTFTINCSGDELYDVTVSKTEPSDGCSVSSGASDLASCSAFTVTATPDSRHQFLGWYDKDELQSNANAAPLSTSLEYTFYVIRHTNLIAKFEFAEYTGMKWYNLFQDGEDITSTSLDKTRNARLWYLLMPYYNKLASTDREIKGMVGTEYDVMEFCYDVTDNLMKDSQSMKWLGDYIISVVGASNMSSASYSAWAKCLYAFINRVGYAKNANGGYTYTATDGYTTPADIINQIKKFGTGDAAPAKWRPWFTEHACKLPNVLDYDDPMPITWNQIPGPNGTTYDTYTTTLPTTGTLLKTPKWYKWNTGGANQLLAWRNGGTDYKKYPIVHHVTTDNMALYATYVDKHIHENDPAVSGQNDATNEDVIKLLANPKYKEAEQTHTLTVTRKLQPGMYNTICLPFGVALNSLADGHPLKNADVRKLTTVTKELYAESGESVMVLNFEQVTTTEPGKPYLVKLADGQQATETLTFSGVYCSDYDALQSDSDNEGLFTFHPTYDPIDIPAGAIILVADNRLAFTTESGRMEGLRGYFTINPELMSADDIQEKAQSGRIYLSMSAPTTTSVPLAPEAEKQEVPKAQKILRNGKIYILRDGKTYSITGARVE